MLIHRIIKSMLVIATALVLHAAPAVAEDSVETGVNRPGRDYKDFEMEPTIAGFAPCQSACQSDKWCRAWTYVSPGIQGPKAHCWLKKSVPEPVNDNCCVSGVSGVITGLEFDTNRPGNDYKDFGIGFQYVELSDQVELRCKTACDKEAQCRAWTYVKPAKEGEPAHCWLKNKVPAKQKNNCCISGVSTKADPQEVADRDPTGKSLEQCEAAFQRNSLRCQQRFGGSIAAKVSCDAEMLQLRAACLGLAAQAAASSDTPTSNVPAEWADMLKAHNDKRKLHCVPPLTWSAQLAAEAQTWADKCTNTHEKGISAGENLAFWTPSASNGQAFQSTWYCEIDHYDFNNPQVVGGFKKGCDPPVNGHFTQVVWKDSRQLGCAKKSCNGGVYWVCRYSPPGNFNADDIGNLRQQVLAPTCSGGQGLRANTAEPEAAGDAPQFARVVQGVDVYDAPGGSGNQTGSLNVGAKVKVIGCEDNWCEVQGKKVPGGSGYVYNGDDYRSLEF